MTKNKNTLNFGQLENKDEGISMNPTYICLLYTAVVGSTHNIFDSTVRIFSQSQ